MHRLRSPLFLALPVPCLWLLVQATHLPDSYSYPGFTEPMWLYGLLPATVLWLGSLPTATATLLLWQRVAAWAIPAFAISAVPSILLVAHTADTAMPIPSGCFMQCPPGPETVLPTSLVAAGRLTLLSLPIWIHLGILRLRHNSADSLER